METLTFSDILKAEDPALSEPVERIFDAKGKPFNVKFRTDCATDADAFYQACGIVSKYVPGIAVQPIKVVFPGVKTFEITNPLYIGELELVSFLVIEPKMNIEQWAVAGKKFGPQFIKVISMTGAMLNHLNDPAKVELDPKGPIPNES